MKTALEFLRENIDQSNIPKEHYELEIADMMDMYAYYYHNEIKQAGIYSNVSGKRPTEKEIHLKSIDAKNIRKQYGYSVSEYVQYHDGFLDGIKWYQAACASAKGGPAED